VISNQQSLKLSPYMDIYILCKTSDAVYMSNPAEQIKKYTILAHVLNKVGNNWKTSDIS